jgi:hypothetical protein
MKIIELILGDGFFSGIEAISLVEQPAIEEEWITLKSQEIKLAEVSKEKRILMGALLVPNKPIYRSNGEDEYYIYFSKKTIEKASQLYLMNGNQNNTTLEHKHTLKGLTLVESWLVEDPVHDKSRKYGLDVPVGTWMGAVKVNSDEVWEEFVKTGRVKGFSIEGYFADKAERPKEPINDLEMKAREQLSTIRKIIKEGEKVELSFKDDASKLSRNQNGFENDFLKERKAINSSINSFNQKVSFLKKDINAAQNLWNRIEKEAIRNETIAEKMLNKINISAKELGIDPSKVDGYKELSEIPSRVSQLKRLMDTARTIVKEMSKRI